MPTDRKTITADVPKDSELARQFEEYRETNSMNSNAEAARTLLRSGLDQEFDDETDDDRDGSDDRARVPTQTRDTGDELQLQFPALTYPLLSSVAFVVGADGLLTALESVLGSAGSWVFVFVGVQLVVWLAYAGLREATSLFGSDETETNTDVQPRGAD